MIRFTAILILTILCLSANAQFGIRVSQNFNKAGSWDDFISNEIGRSESVFTSSQSYTLDYWLRLPNHRVEFYPNISYHRATDLITNIGVGGSESTSVLDQIGAGLLVHIYAFDFTGDCDCPTFSKQGGLVKKGFFFMGGVGADFARKKFGDGDLADGNFDVKASLGLGIDIGLTDLLTITPFVQIQRYFDVSGHNLSEVFNSTGNISSSINQLQVGLRLGLRADYSKPRF